MAIRNIVKYGDPILLKKSREVEIDSRTLQLLDDLIDTLHLADGLGLAAPQVGVLKRIAIILDENNNVIELINPQILSQHGVEIDNEGCLSVPGRFAEVERPKEVVVGTYDRKGDYKKITLHGLQARAVCHEIDHLDGIIFVSKAIRFLDDQDIESARNK